MEKFHIPSFSNILWEFVWCDAWDIPTLFCVNHLDNLTVLIKKAESLNHVGMRKQCPQHPPRLFARSWCCSCLFLSFLGPSTALPCCPCQSHHPSPPQSLHCQTWDETPNWFEGIFHLHQSGQIWEEFTHQLIAASVTGKGATNQICWICQLNSAFLAGSMFLLCFSLCFV